MSAQARKVRALISVASALALAAGGLMGCASAGDNGVTVAGDLTASSISSPVPSVPAGSANEEETTTPPAPAAESDESEVDPAGTPGAISTRPALTWTEFDPDEAFGPDWDELIRIESVGDGRVLALSFSDRGSDSLLVTENGVEWIPVRVPAGFSPRAVDVAGDRWVTWGWVPAIEAPSEQILFSDDGGASWTELEIDLDSVTGTARMADAIVAGEVMVVVVESHGEPPHVGGHGQEEHWRDDGRVHIFVSSGGPADLAVEFPGWYTGGHGASDGFHLIVFSPDGLYLLNSPDGREWASTTVDVEITGIAGDVVWTAHDAEGQLRRERFVGVYGPDLVLTRPDGIGWVVDLAVGPAGVAVVGSRESPYTASGGDFALPDVRIEKDGYELRYNEPEGGITMWDLTGDIAVYVFDAETLQSEDQPEGTREVENEEGLLVVEFLDPESGDVLVEFSDEELAAAITDDDNASTSTYHYASGSAFDRYEFLVGWSPDGTDWQWQTLLEAFGVPSLGASENSFTEVQVAVGRDFILAQVQTHEFPPTGFDEGAETGSRPSSAPLTAVDSSTSTPRWFIARVR